MGLLHFLRAKGFELLEQHRVKKRYYPNYSFQKIDRQLCSRYRDRSPYTVSSDFQKQQGYEGLHVYGETPLTTMDQIATECDLGPDDHVIEMGAGRGRSALFLAEYIGCTVTAYEKIPEFAQKMVESKKCTMVPADMFSASFDEASAIYLYGTLLDEEEIRVLCTSFPKGKKIITVSYPLSDYSKAYKTIKTFSGAFPWGKTEVYWNERIV